MSTTEKLVAAQTSIGKTLTQLFENFTKERTERRSIEVTNKYKQNLEEQWNQFVQNDNQLRELQAENKDNLYFTKNYFESVEQHYQKFLQKILERLEKASESSDVLEPTEVHKPGVESDSNTSQQTIIRKQQATMEALNKLLLAIEQDKASQRTKVYLTNKIKAISEYWAEITQNHREIMAHGDHYRYKPDSFSELEIKYQNIKIMLEEYLENNSITPQCKLPKITLPIFDGSYMKWKQFQDLFEQLIHNQPIGSAQKMFYLKANLTGEASKLIRHLQATDDNYNVAWGILLDRYDNKRSILTTLLNELLSQPSLSTESCSALKRLHDTTKECMLAIGNLDIQTENWDPIILHILLQKLDRESRKAYEQNLQNPRNVQTLKYFFEFLETRFHQLETMLSRDERRKPSAFMVAPQECSCNVCKTNGHKIFNCSKFLKLSSSERMQVVKRLQLCPNCLRSNHTVRQCKARSCAKCNQRHNTLLHHSQNTSKSATTPPNINKQLSKQEPTAAASQVDYQSKSYHQSTGSSLNATLPSNVMLATAVIYAFNASGVPILCRVLLDSGSQLHFITEQMVNQLGLKRTRTDIQISAVGGLDTTANHKTSITIRSRVTDYLVTIDAVILPKIGERQPTAFVDTKTWKLPPSVVLADPAFYNPQNIDMLIGAELYYEILKAGQQKFNHSQPILQNTELGWVVSGRVPESYPTRHLCYIASQPSLKSLEQQVQQFWEIEQHDSPTKRLTKEEVECEDHFQKTFQRLPSGQFMVQLPFLKEPACLGDSLQLATKRFLSLERKLCRDPNLKKAYTEFLEEYKTLGHMEHIKTEHLPKSHFFLPHHGVVKPESSTTKLRVVFDGSAKSTSGLSLNDILAVGPCVQPDLFTIITRFRSYRYVVTADISKMYRQVMIERKDRKFQLILWRESPQDPLQYYKLNTITYGTASAPFLATRCLKQLALDGEDTFPLAAEALQLNTYVDDILAGADTLDRVKALKNELTALLKDGHFELRKFCANHPAILSDVPEEHREKSLYINSTEAIKTLGLVWQPREDTFQCHTSSEGSDKITKRIALSEVARLFDPLGLIAPVVVLGKLFVQELWKSNMTWDEEIPLQLRHKWMSFKKNLKEVQRIRIPRAVIIPEAEHIQLHAFSDSSILAYGACCYLRSMDKYGQILVRLLCSKSRIAPLKSTTLARLELCGALLMAELVDRLLQCLPTKIERVVYYTDSTTVLSWISNPSYSWTTFVANRVARIQTLTARDQWRHIEGTQNPADLVSRGALPQALAQSSLWFNGPGFLQETEDKWPTGSFQINLEAPEAKTRKFAFVTNTQREKYTDIISSINHKASLSKLQRIVGYCVRFINNCKLPKQMRASEELTLNELELAENSIIRNVQRTSFKTEYICLRREGALDKKSPILTLCPFLDEATEIIRVGGRLRHTDLEKDAKYQIILPKNHVYTELLIRHLHLKHMHAAPQTLVAIAKQRFWPLDAKKIAQRIVHQCIRCFRCKPQTMTQVMGDLPKERVQPGRPFHTTGVDFCGPCYVHHKIRGRAPTKAYIALFVCFKTKAVHLELVSDLSSEAFINSLKRFISRRGLCRTIHCDNATNFIGAKSELRELKEAFTSQSFQSQIQELCQLNYIEWKPIPPRSPHFGGLWEAAVKSAKYHLIRQLGNANVTYEELHTVITQIEAILNSRPLTPISSDPNDLEALTPGHFLIGAPLTSFAEPDISEENFNNLSRYQRLQHIQQNFWKRWSTEYLNQLQTRTKWTESKPNIKPGTLVLLKEQNSPPLKWPLGRIVETIEGPDKRIRVVIAKTASGTYKRAIHNVCPLPIESDNEESKSNSVLNNEKASQSVNTSQGAEREEISKCESSHGRHKITQPAHAQTAHKATKSKFCPINTNWLKRVNSIPKEHYAKQPKVVSGSVPKAFSLLLCLALILPIHGQSYEINSFESYPGIYYDNMGELSLVESNWNLIVYYNLTNYWKELEALDKSIDNINYLCHYLTEPSKHYCMTIANQLNLQVNTLHHNNEILRNNHEHSTRLKRSPFDIIGTIGNKLFGILDAEYAKNLEKTIDDITSNEANIRDLITKQTSIIDSTLNIIKRDEEHINAHFKMVEQVVNELISDYKNTTKKLEEQHFIQLFTTFSIHASLIIISYQQIQNALLNLVLNIHHGKISPLLLTPAQIKEELQLMREYLPANTILPVEAGENGYSNVYKLLTANCRITDTKAIFEVKFPLLNQEKFQIYRLIALPIPTAKQQKFIKLSAQFLGANLHRDKFLTFSTQQFASCMKLSEGRYLCPGTQPLATRLMNHHNCEINLFQPKLDVSFSNCELRTSNITEWWQQLPNRNTWIFWLKNEATVTIVCASNSTQETLKGQGIIRFHNQCSLKHHMTAITSGRRHSNIFRAAFIPAHNMSLYAENTPAVELTNIHLNQTLDHQRQIESLKETISELRNASIRFKPHSPLDPHELHQYSVSYMSLLLALLLAAIISYYILCKQRRRDLSQPPQREEDFELQNL